MSTDNNAAGSAPGTNATGQRPFIKPFVLGLATFFFVNGLTLMFLDESAPALTVSAIAGFAVYMFLSYRGKKKTDGVDRPD